MTQQSLCAGCGASILWAFTPAGKRMPLDAEPLTDPPGTLTHMNHWTSCPVRDSFRSKP